MSETEIVSGVEPKALALFFGLLEANTGIALGPSKEYLLNSRLGGLARDNGLTSVSALVDRLLRIPVGSLHWQAFDAMATHETFFFRDKLHFELLKNELMPKMLQKNADKRQLNIWCAAASTGQEPYSMAILLQEEFALLQNWKISIHATDMSDKSLAQARSGIYSSIEMGRGLNAEQIKRHFDPLATGQYQIHAGLRQCIQFYRLNLLDTWSQLPLFDLILLRNALIYFNQETKAVVLKKISSHLSETTGYLMLGSSESIFFDPSLTTRRVERVTYYRKAVVSGSSGHSQN